MSNSRDYDSMKSKLMNDKIKVVPNPMNSMIYFLTLTILYGIFTIYTIIGSSRETAKSTSQNKIVLLIYVCFLVSGMYFINLKTSQELCNTEKIQYYNVFFATFIPWIIIFGTLYFLLELFNGWILPFSNTIGYYVVYALGRNH